MSSVMTNLAVWELQAMSDTNLAIEPQKIGRGVKFGIFEGKGLYYMF